MTRVFRKYYCLVILWILPMNNYSQNGFNENSWYDVIFLDETTIEQLPAEFYLFSPKFTNSIQTKNIQPITYLISKVSKADFIKNISLGTYLCSFREIDEDSISSVNLYKEYPITQLIKKESDGYIGYLEELMEVPFVLPPRWLTEGHQADLRLGVDCAELAIYGKRRLGHKIPYCGPKRIIEYLYPVEKAERGVIVSFANNYQISVIYDDKGIIGVLDDEDLLIHAYKDKAEIIRLGDTELKHYPYKLYQWKE